MVKTHNDDQSIIVIPTVRYLCFGIKDRDNFMVDGDQRGRGAAVMTYFLSSEYIKSKERQRTDTFW